MYCFIMLLEGTNYGTCFPCTSEGTNYDIYCPPGSIVEVWRWDQLKYLQGCLARAEEFQLHLVADNSGP